MPLFCSWAMTHPGTKRRQNQDAYVDRPDRGLWAVADGAGGHQAGEVASDMIRASLEAIPDTLHGPALGGAVRACLAATHAALLQEASQRGPHATVASTVVVLLADEAVFECLWAGDSRAYLLRDGVLRQVSRDHSLVQELVDAGAITPDEAEQHPHANVITRAVGAAQGDFTLDACGDGIRPGDRFLLCSDGLSKALPAEHLARLLATEDAPSEALVAAALARKATDNVTALVVLVPPV